MKTPDQPGKGWALPDPFLGPSPDVLPLSADPAQEPAPPPPPQYAPYLPHGDQRFNGQHAAPPPPLPLPPRPAKVSWTVPAGPGTPFHRLARTSLHSWWRPLVGTLFAVAIGLVAIVGVMLTGMLAATVMGDNPLANAKHDKIFSNPTVDLGIQLIALAILTPVVLLAAWLVQRRPMGSLSSVRGRLRGRWLIVCAGMAVVACLLSYTAAWFALAVSGAKEAEPLGWAGWSSFLPSAVVILLLVPFQAAAEEYLFRGWLLQAIASCTLQSRTGRIGRAASALFRTPWPAILISAAVFAAGHAYKGWALLDVLLFGIVAGWLAVRTGGLEAPIALHLLNNLVAFLLPAATGQLGNAMRANDAPWQAIVGTVVQLVAFAILVLLSVRRRRIQTLSARPEPIAAPVLLPAAVPA